MRARFLAGLAALAVLIGIIRPETSSAQAAQPVRLPFPPGYNARIIQGYNGGTHNGVDPYAIDLTVANGTTSGAPVVTPFAGSVTYTSGGPRVGNGCLTLAMDGGGYSAMLCHVIFDRAFGRGERLAAGQRIGTVGPAGTVGNNGTPHVHLELYDARRTSAPFAYPRGLPLEGVELTASGLANEHAGRVISSGGGSAPADSRTTTAPSARGATTGSRLSGPAVVTGTEGCVNVRATAGLNGRIIDCLRDGVRVTVVEGPQTANGRSWYRLQGLGWVVGDYLRAAG